MEALMFLTEKRDKTVKGRMVYNGKPTREWLDKEDSASPTVALESIMLTAVIDAKEERDVMSADVPNAFIQTPMPERKNREERVVMKITGVLVDLLASTVGTRCLRTVHCIRERTQSFVRPSPEGNLRNASGSITVVQGVPR